MKKAAFNNKTNLFISKLDLNLRKELVKCCIWSIALCCAELGHFGKVNRSTWKVLQCGAGEGWR